MTTLHKDKTHEFLLRWRSLVQRQRDLDHARSQWAHDLRSQFDKRSEGDADFVRWCQVNLDLGSPAINELLDRARAISDVPDEKTWKDVGGFSQIRVLQQIPRGQRAAVVEACKLEKRKVRSVARSRGLIAGKPRTSTKVPANIVDSELLEDARALADYVMELSRRFSVSPHIVRVARRRATGGAVTDVKLAA